MSKKVTNTEKLNKITELAAASIKKSNYVKKHWTNNIQGKVESIPYPVLRQFFDKKVYDYIVANHPLGVEYTFLHSKDYSNRDILIDTGDIFDFSSGKVYKITQGAYKDLCYAVGYFSFFKPKIALDIANTPYHALTKYWQNYHIQSAKVAVSVVNGKSLRYINANEDKLAAILFESWKKRFPNHPLALMSWESQPQIFKNELIKHLYAAHNAFATVLPLYYEHV